MSNFAGRGFIAAAAHLQSRAAMQAKRVLICRWHHSWPLLCGLSAWGMPQAAAVLIPARIAMQAVVEYDELWRGGSCMRLLLSCACAWCALIFCSP